MKTLYLKALLSQEIGFFDNEISMGQVIGLMSGDAITIQDVLCEKVIFFFLLFFFFFGSWIVEGNAKNYFIDEWNKGNWSWFHG